MYKTIEEKTKLFNQTTIKSEDELRFMISSLSARSCLRFRGVCEAKYTMLTSLQRNCPSIMLGRQKEYMSNLLHRVKTNPDVLTYFQRKGIAINDISCMALMQHQGLPTPFLDFSTDLFVALSFAADGVKLESCSVETDNYVSLYVFDTVFEHEVGIPVQQIYMNGMASGIRFLQDCLRQNPNRQLNASILYEINEFVKWSDIKDLELSYVEYQPLAPIVATLSGQKLNLSNPNLDRQKGCFLLNLYDEQMPLEENWNMRTSEQRKQFWIKSGSAVQALPFCGVETKEKMRCFDIHKAVIMKWASANAIPLYDKSDENQSIKTILAEIQKELNEEITVAGNTNTIIEE